MFKQIVILWPFFLFIISTEFGVGHEFGYRETKPWVSEVKIKRPLNSPVYLILGLTTWENASLLPGDRPLLELTDAGIRVTTRLSSYTVLIIKQISVTEWMIKWRRRVLRCAFFFFRFFNLKKSSYYAWAKLNMLTWFHSIALHILCAHHFLAWLARARSERGRKTKSWAVQRNKWSFSPKLGRLPQFWRTNLNKNSASRYYLNAEKNTSLGIVGYVCTQ